MDKTFLLTHLKSSKEFEVYGTTHPSTYKLTIVKAHVHKDEFGDEKPPKYIRFALMKAEVTGG